MGEKITEIKRLITEWMEENPDLSDLSLSDLLTAIRDRFPGCGAVHRDRPDIVCAIDHKEGEPHGNPKLRLTWTDTETRHDDLGILVLVGEPETITEVEDTAQESPASDGQVNPLDVLIRVSEALSMIDDAYAASGSKRITAPMVREIRRSSGPLDELIESLKTHRTTS